MQMCIYPPKPRTPRSRPPANDWQYNAQAVAWSCSESAVMEAVREKDPFGRGLPSPIALRLLQVISDL